MVLLALAALLLSPGAAEQTPYEALWTDLLEAVVTDDGFVRYDLLAGPRRADFDAVADAVERFDARTLDSDAERLAFWLNAYNVKLVERVLEAGIPDNIEAHGFDAFFKSPVRVAGHDVTLDQIEHVILRRQDGPAALEALAVDRLDPRIHVGLNCGAVSCPRLRPRALTAANVHTELDRAMRDFVNSPSHFLADGDGFVLSSLLDWFGSDFDAAGKPAGNYLLQFMDSERPGYERLRALFAGRSAAEIKAQPGVRFVYVWDLNAAS